MIYICIDTNVYIKALTEVIENNETTNAPTQLDNLDILCREGVVKLMIPEIIKLELRKADIKAEEDYRKSYSSLVDTTDKAITELWNEVRDIREKLINLIEEEQDVKIRYWKDEYKKLELFFNKDYTQKIQLTPDIFCEAYKKKISGLITDSQMNDALIMESISSYLETQSRDNDDIVFFITGDNKDFFVKGTHEGFYKLKAKFEISKPKIYGLYNLKQLYKYIDANCEIDRPNDLPVGGMSLKENIRNGILMMIKLELNITILRKE